MNQITPQMRILVAVEAVDGRKGIDSPARLCREKLQCAERRGKLRPDGFLGEELQKRCTGSSASGS